MPGPRSSKRQNELSALKEKTRKRSLACKAEGKACRHPRGRWKHNTGGSGAARGGERFGCYGGRGVGGSVSGTCRHDISAPQKNSVCGHRQDGTIRNRLTSACWQFRNRVYKLLAQDATVVCDCRPKQQIVRKERGEPRARDQNHRDSVVTRARGEQNQAST